MVEIHQTIGQVLDDVAKRYPDRDALIHISADAAWSYGQLRSAVDDTAAGMLAAGFEPEDKIALWAPNLAEWLIAFLALAKLGAVTVPVDPAAPDENITYILEQSGCRALIASAGDQNRGLAHRAVAAMDKLPGLDKVVVIGNHCPKGAISWHDISVGVSDGHHRRAVDIAGSLKPRDPVAIMYTSGTTGAPKGVVLDHLGLINKSMHATKRQGITAQDRLCLFFPLFHMFGNTCIALAGLIRGASLIIPSTEFDPAAILKAIPGQACTAIYGSPSMLIALVDHPEFRESDWVTVKKGIIGGAPCPMELMRRIVTDIGVSDITVAWGITETASWITMTRPNDPIELRVSTIGTPLACSEVKIVDPKTGLALEAGKQGELCTRGYLMIAYYRMPGATAAAIDRNGWFHTGDLGKMDRNGYVRITGRLKDVIVRDGINIYPVEVEEAIYELPQVSEVQVFGFEDKIRGQQMAAWLKLKEGERLSIPEVADHVKQRLPAELHPAHYKIVSDFPMTGSGKVQKYKLAQMAAEAYGGGGM